MELRQVYARAKELFRDFYSIAAGKLKQERKITIETINSLEQRLKNAEEISKELEKQATIDLLTGAYNRRMLEREVICQASMKKRNPDYVYSLIVFDLKKFKSVNENYGHTAGDRLLCYLVKYWTAQFRLSDKLFRWAGDEFVMILPNTSKEEVENLVERLNTRVTVTDIFSGKKTLAMKDILQINTHSKPTEGTDRGEDLYAALGELFDEAKRKS